MPVTITSLYISLGAVRHQLCTSVYRTHLTYIRLDHVAAVHEGRFCTTIRRSYFVSSSFCPGQIADVIKFGMNWNDTN